MNNSAKVFEFLYKNSGSEYNINQISRILGISVGSAFKILKGLEMLGYIAVSRKHNALLHRISVSEKAKEFYEKIEEEESAKSRKKTKVVCNILPGSSIAFIKKLAERGMDAACIDASVFDYKTALEAVKSVRQASDEIPILLNAGSKGRQWIKFALKNGLDFVAVSAANAGDIRQINRILGYNDIKQVIGEKIKVISVIGKESLRNCREIVEESYGVIIDRRRLAAANLEMLPKLQKEIAGECSKYGRPAIIAGSILDSMAKSRQPLQPEIYDISNAVLDGASALMLSNEVAAGKFQMDAVETLSNAIKGAEACQAGSNCIPSHDLTHFIGNAVSELEKTLRIDALLIITSGGYSARMISGRRLKCRTIAATSRKKVARQLNLLRGITPLYAGINAEDISNSDKKQVILKALKRGFIGKRDRVAIIASVFHSKAKRTNLLEVHNVSEFLDYMGRIREAQ